MKFLMTMLLLFLPFTANSSGSCEFPCDREPSTTKYEGDEFYMEFAKLQEYWHGNLALPIEYLPKQDEKLYLRGTCHTQTEAHTHQPSFSILGGAFEHDCSSCGLRYGDTLYAEYAQNEITFSIYHPKYAAITTAYEIKWIDLGGGPWPLIRWLKQRPYTAEATDLAGFCEVEDWGYTSSPSMPSISDYTPAYSTVQTEIHFDNLKVCSETSKIDSFASREFLALEVGYSCKVPTIETRPDEEGKGYAPSEDYAIWTFFRNAEGRPIWAVHTESWGTIYVGYVEDDSYSFDEAQAQAVCDKKEKIILPNGEHLEIQMTLPEIGFGLRGTDPNNLLNAEFLLSRNYTSVISWEGRRWFWSSSSLNAAYAWAFDSVVGGNGHTSDHRRDSYAIRCVGLHFVD